MKQFKLGVGPMSAEIVDLCLEYSKTHDFPIMIIASRNQVDADSGYAFTTPDLVSYVKQNSNYDANRVLICRDHCGPHFSDSDQKTDALANCIKTIKADIDSGFDLLHIDVSRVDDAEQEHTAKLLLDYALSLNPNIIFEFGSEDNTGEGLTRSLNRLTKQLKFVSAYENSIKFFVSQTGSLTKHKQVGKFDVSDNTKIAELIHNSRLLFKEHNADYLTADQVNLRKQAGVDAINIAPQLGTIQSKIIRQLGDQLGETYVQFVSYVLEQGYWKKWITDEVTDNETKFEVSAHYCFSSDLGKKLMAKVRSENLPFDALLRQQLFKELDEYRTGYEYDTNN